MENGNFAAAVLTYNEALKLDPEDPAIQSLLREAGEMYQQQKGSLEQRRMAIQAFNDHMAACQEVDAIIVPIGDGLWVGVRR